MARVRHTSQPNGSSHSPQNRLARKMWLLQLFSAAIASICSCPADSARASAGSVSRVTASRRWASAASAIGTPVTARATISVAAGRCAAANTRYNSSGSSRKAICSRAKAATPARNSSACATTLARVAAGSSPTLIREGT